MKTNKALIILALLALLASACNTTTETPESPEPTATEEQPLSEACLDFEDLTLWTHYSVGDNFVTSGVRVTVKEFIYSDGTPVAGIATVESGDIVRGSGNEIRPDGVNLAFDFGGPVDGLTLLFRETGEPLSIGVNGDVINFDSFTNIDGRMIKGVSVSVQMDESLGEGQGVLVLTGTISSFAIGGQDLIVDEVCPGPNLPQSCLGFEDLTLWAEYGVGNSFTTSGVKVTVKEYTNSNGTPNSGVARVISDGAAGGSGNEIWPNEVNLAFDFGGPVDGLRLLFARYLGSLNIEINGEFANIAALADIDGTVLGGVNVSVLAGGPSSAQHVLVLVGTINSFSIGGRELIIDEVCHGSQLPQSCLDFETLALGQQYSLGDSFSACGVNMTVEDLIYSRKPVNQVAEVISKGGAGGSGNEIYLNGLMLAFDFGGAVDSLRLRFGEYAGNLNIEINGSRVYFDNFADIDGTVIGGTRVSVPAGGSGDQAGVLVLTGTISSFSIGGIEFIIDDVCLVGEVPEVCLDFEDLTSQTQYNVGDSFTTSGIKVTVREFINSSGTPVGVFAQVDDRGNKNPPSGLEPAGG